MAKASDGRELDLRQQSAGGNDPCHPLSARLRGAPEPSLDVLTVEQAHKVLVDLKPISVLVLVTRCAMRVREIILANLDSREFTTALSEYDASIRDGFAVCIAEGWGTKQLLAKEISEDAVRALQTQRSPEIDRVIAAFSIAKQSANCDRFLLQSASINAIDTLGQMILASQGRVRQPDPAELFELALTILSWELSKLTFVEGEESFDPSKGGPLNGLWPNGVPSEFVIFNKAPVLNLRLHKTSFEGNIPPASCEEEIRHVQGGRAAEPLETEMDVRSVGDQHHETPPPTWAQLSFQPIH